MRSARTIRIAALLALLLAPPVRADEPIGAWVEREPGGAITVHLWFFWTRSCPHCLEAKPFVETLASEPGVAVHALELTEHPENVERFRTLASAVGEQARAVPAFVVCGRMLVGFDADVTPAAIRDGIARCRDATPGARTAPNAEPLPPLPGGLDAATLSLPVLALVLGGLDSLNPCAFFVLLFLLSLLVHARSRAHMLAVGAVFVAISGLAYFAFMAAWLNLFLLLGELRAVTVGAGLLAVVLGSINARDGLRTRGTTTLAIPESAKPGLFARMRKLVRAERLSTMVAATIALALVANLYELLCTAGFPMVFTRILTLRALPAATYYLYLALYNAVYVTPLLAIVGVFAWTLGSRKLSEREGHLLKLLSGLMMAGLGVVLLVAPAWLSRPWVALALLMLAATATAFVARVTRARVRSETATERPEKRS
jgi:thiol-disulfide isomerase/thioredoxin